MKKEKRKIREYEILLLSGIIGTLIVVISSPTCSILPEICGLFTMPVMVFGLLLGIASHIIYPNTLWNRAFFNV